MKNHRSSLSRRTLALFLCGIFASLVLPAQDQSIFLLDLPGDRVAVRYSHGSLDRAVHLQDLFDTMVEDYRAWTRAKVGLVILLLSREDWKLSGFSYPYGMSEAAGGRGLALPSWGDDGTVELWRGLLGTRLPTQPEQPMRGTPEQTASLAVADLIGSTEAARILLRSSGIRGDQPWVDSLIAQLVSLSNIESHHAARLPDIRMVYADLSTRAGGLAAHPLSNTAAPPTLAVRLWFESQFFAGAAVLAGQGCKQEPKAVFKQARKAGGMILGADLISKCPALDQWLQSNFKAQ